MMVTKFELSGKFCLHNKTIILSQTDTSVVVGLCTDNTEIRERIKREFYRRIESNTVDIEFKTISEELWQRTISKLFSKNLIGLTQDTELKQVETEAEEAPIINLLNLLIIECHISKGSDIHIEYKKNAARVRFRIQGYLYDQMEISYQTGDSLIQRIKLLAKMELAEKRKCQDGRFDFNQQDYSIDIRVSSVPSYFGESVVLRLLDRNASLLELKELGFSTLQLRALKTIQKEEHGLILICGPTGSGKTTTLSSLLHSMDKKEKKIITIEDPVEYVIDDVIQVPVQSDIEMDFADVLRRIYRQDPDIIVVGEIRDELTAHTAMRCAMTGHLVLATLHTCSAVETLSRLLDMGIQRYVLSPILQWIIVQKLVPKKNKTRMLQASIYECTDEIKNAISCVASYEELKLLFNKNLKASV